MSNTPIERAKQQTSARHTSRLDGNGGSVSGPNHTHSVRPDTRRPPTSWRETGKLRSHIPPSGPRGKTHRECRGIWNDEYSNHRHANLDRRNNRPKRGTQRKRTKVTIAQDDCQDVSHEGARLTSRHTRERAEGFQASASRYGTGHYFHTHSNRDKRAPDTRPLRRLCETEPTVQTISNGCRKVHIISAPLRPARQTPLRREANGALGDENETGKTELEKATNRTRRGSRTTPTHDGGAEPQQQGVIHTVHKVRHQEEPEREVVDEDRRNADTGSLVVVQRTKSIIETGMPLKPRPDTLEPSRETPRGCADGTPFYHSATGPKPWISGRHPSRRKTRPAPISTDESTK